MNNYMKLEISALGENESFARSAVAAFALYLNPSLTELSDIKTAVSEAVTNCIVHAYRHGNERDKIVIECQAEKEENSPFGQLHIEITDYGCGIDDLERAISPFYTTLTEEERSGMGFTIMQTFTDKFSVESEKGRGTKVKMVKKIGIDGNKEAVKE
ncbi:MAG: anti-sigma F factor [Clostridia bacterium]|nr:anti-sigma F factor [Clostridia bacterium]